MKPNLVVILTQASKQLDKDSRRKATFIDQDQV